MSVADLHVGSSVYSSHGEKIGRLRFMMVDPDSESVSHLILEKGMLLAQDVLCPVSSVQQVLFRGIFLDSTAEEVLNLPEFNEARYLARERAHGGDRGEPRDNGPRHHHHHNDGGGDRGNNGGGGHRRPRGRFRRH